MNECTDLLKKINPFSTLKSNFGCYRIEIDEKDRENAAFTSLPSLYQFILMPFGLRNVPASLQRAM